MSSTVANDLCRLTVVAAGSRADVAVPATLRLGEVLPALVRHLDPQLGLHAEGTQRWVLQRLGDEPFDEDLTPEALGLRDGEVLHLRAQDAPIPPIDFDDVVDGVTAATAAGPGRWRPELARRLFLGLGAAGLVAALVHLLAPAAVMPRAIVSGAEALALAGAATAAARAWAERTVAVVLGLAAVPFAAMAGLLMVGALSGSGAASGGLALFDSLSAHHVLAAGASAAAVAVLAALGTALARSLFLSIGVIATGVALGAGLALAGLTAVQAAALTATLAFAVSLFAPTLAARLAGLRVPHLPSDATELQHDIDPTPETVVFDRTASAARHLSAMCVATSVLVVGCATLLATGHGWAPPALTCVLAVAMMVRSRVFVNTWQRLAAMLAGAGCAVVLVIGASWNFGAVAWLLVSTALVITAVTLLVAARPMPGRRLLPLWGRAADIAETMFAIAVVPILLQVLQAYAWLRGLSG